MMDERERKELAWRSCYLGMRVAMQALDLPQNGESFTECLRFLGEVARGETTAHEPLSSPADLTGETKRLLAGIGNKAVLSDRDLAPLVVAGLDQAAASEDGPETLPLHVDRPPLRVDEGGAVRVGQSRIALDLIVREYENGMTPDDMVRAYDALGLADVYAAIAYYLRHRVEVAGYLDRREKEAARLRALIEDRQPPRPTKEELLARRLEKDHAEAGQ